MRIGKSLSGRNRPGKFAINVQFCITWYHLCRLDRALVPGRNVFKRLWEHPSDLLVLKTTQHCGIRWPYMPWRKNMFLDCFLDFLGFGYWGFRCKICLDCSGHQVRSNHCRLAGYLAFWFFPEFFRRHNCDPMAVRWTSSNAPLPRLSDGSRRSETRFQNSRLEILNYHAVEGSIVKGIQGLYCHILQLIKHLIELQRLSANWILLIYPISSQIWFWGCDDWVKGRDDSLEQKYQKFPGSLL